MGMDLKPVRPNKKYPRNPLDAKYEPGKPQWGRYNCWGWSYLLKKLDAWGLQEQLPVYNDGELIPAKVCKKIAALITEHESELKGTEQEWILKDVIEWENCGGFRVY